MNYGEVKTQFMALLNRRDITPTLVDTFMGFGIQRIQREIRVPAMERVVGITMDGTAQFRIPGDLLEIISLHTNDTIPTRLIRTDLQTILEYAKVEGSPKYFYREDANISVGPYPPVDSIIYLHYYADASTIVADTDENWITAIAPVLLIYAALSYAADYFLDDRKTLFENSYLQTSMQIMDMAMQDEISGAAITRVWNLD